MAIQGTSPEGLRKFTQWLDRPLTTGKEKELNDWLGDDPDHQLSWDRWTEFNASAKVLQIISSEAAAEWAVLRDELGFEHSKKKKQGRKSRSKKRSIFRSAEFIALTSMIVYALFLAVLYLIRTSSVF